MLLLALQQEEKCCRKFCRTIEEEAVIGLYRILKGFIREIMKDNAIKIKKKIRFRNKKKTGVSGDEKAGTTSEE